MPPGFCCAVPLSLSYSWELISFKMMNQAVQFSYCTVAHIQAKTWNSYSTERLIGCTVEPRYVELGYLELPAISNRIGFSLDLPVFFQSFTMGYLELGCLEHPAISNCFLLPLAQINPGYLELFCVPKKHWSKSVRKCSQGTSRQDALKAEKCIDVFTVLTKAKSDWLDLLLNAECDRLPVFVDQTITPGIWPTSLSRTPAISNSFSIPLRVRDSGVLLYFSQHKLWCTRGTELSLEDKSYFDLHRVTVGKLVKTSVFDITSKLVSIMLWPDDGSDVKNVSGVPLVEGINNHKALGPRIPHMFWPQLFECLVLEYISCGVF